MHGDTARQCTCSGSTAVMLQLVVAVSCPETVSMLAVDACPACASLRAQSSGDAKLADCLDCTAACAQPSIGCALLVAYQCATHRAALPWEIGRDLRVGANAVGVCNGVA